MRPFDVVFIDFFGTVSGGDRDAVVGACRGIVEECGLPVSPEEFAVAWGEHFFQVIERSNHEAFRTLYECEVDSLRDMLRAHDLAQDPAPFVAELESYWANPPLYEDARQFLKKVDLPVCCISNADTAPLYQAIERHGLRFEAVITSEDARCYKPDPEIFRRGIEAMNVKPSRAIHVGDSLHSDVGGAAGVGLTTVWLHRENRIHDVGQCVPDHSVGSLTDLFAILA